MKHAFEVLMGNKVIVNGAADSEQSAQRTAFALKGAFPGAIVRYQISPIQWGTAETQSLDDIR